MATKDISISQEIDRIVRGDGRIVDTIEYWTVQWTEANEGFIGEDYRRDFMDEDAARVFARALERRA